MGPDGSFYWHSIKGAAIAATNAEHLRIDLLAAGVTNAPSMTLHTLLNEGRVEHSFGDWVMRSLSDMPTMQQYLLQKPKMARSMLNRFGATRFSRFTSRVSFYQETQQSDVPAHWLMAEAEKVHAAFAKRRAAPQPLPAERRRSGRKNASELKCIATLQRRSAVRSYFKGSIGFGPTVLEADALPTGAGPTYASFRDALRQQLERDAAAPGPLSTLQLGDDGGGGGGGDGGANGARRARPLVQPTRATHLFLEGDLLFVMAGEWEERNDAGELEAVDHTELWWAIQVTRALELGKDRPRCWVYCYYLEQQPEDGEGNSRRRLVSGNELHVFYEELVIDPVTKRPFSVASHDLPMGWDSRSNVVYSLPADLCTRLDRAARRRLDPAEDEGGNDSAADEGGGDDDDEQPSSSSGGDGSSAVRDAREQRRMDRAAANEGHAAALRVRLEG